MSTLHPGQVSKAIAALRDAAIAEMDAQPEGTKTVGSPRFDMARDTHDPDSGINPETDGWVARYPGQNCPHVGNGNGGVR